MAVLIIVAQSRRQVQSDTPMRAADRYQGVYFRVLNKYIREHRLNDADILIVTDKIGIVSYADHVPYSETFSKAVASGDIEETRKHNLEILKQWLARKPYAEVYVNCGRDFLRLIEGFEKLTSAKVTFATGSGLGPKAAHMKQWILKRYKRQ